MTTFVTMLNEQGKYLDLAATAADYAVAIGYVPCNVTRLTSTAIHCRPLRTSAGSNKETKDTRRHRVEVLIDILY